MWKLPWIGTERQKITCRGKTLWGTLKSLRRKGLRSWHSSKCVPSQLLYTDAFWSERKPSSLLNHSTLRDRMWGSNLPSVCCSLPWDSESGSVPASLSPTKRQASGQPQGERCETLAQPSCLWARLTACTGRGGSSFFWPQASVLGEPGIKKKTISFLWMALTESLLVVAPHCSHLFTELTVTYCRHVCITTDIHNLTCTYLHTD